MLTKEEFLKKIGQTEEELKEKGLELMFIGEVGYGDGEDDGWDVVYIDPIQCVEVGLGCKCTVGGTLHDKL
ncbi:MAG: hypothetical protein ACRC6J_04680 [Cetobacterium sp.]